MAAAPPTFAQEPIEVLLVRFLLPHVGAAIGNFVSESGNSRVWIMPTGPHVDVYKSLQDRFPTSIMVDPVMLAKLAMTSRSAHATLTLPFDPKHWLYPHTVEHLGLADEMNPSNVLNQLHSAYKYCRFSNLTHLEINVYELLVHSVGEATMCWALRQTMEYRVLIERFAGEDDAIKDVWVRPGFLSRAVECLQTHLKLRGVENDFQFLGTALPSWHALPAMARDLAFAPSQMMCHDGMFQYTCHSERDEHLHCFGHHSPVSMGMDATDGLEMRRIMIGAENVLVERPPHAYGLYGRDGAIHESRVFPSEAIMTMNAFTSFQNTLADVCHRFPPWRLPQATAEERRIGQITLDSILEQTVLADRAGVYTLVRPRQALQIDSRYRARHFEIALRRCYETSQHSSVCSTPGEQVTNECGRDPQRIRTPLDFFVEYCGSVLDVRPGFPIFGHHQPSIGVECAREPLAYSPIDADPQAEADALSRVRGGNRYPDELFRGHGRQGWTSGGQRGLVDTGLSTSSAISVGEGHENGESEVSLEEPEEEESIEDDGLRAPDFRSSTRFQNESVPLQFSLPEYYMRDRIRNADQNTEDHQNTEYRDFQDEQMLFGDVGDVVLDPEQDAVPTTWPVVHE